MKDPAETTVDNPSRAPLVEVVLAAQFRPISGFSSAHAGLFWNELRNEYGELTEAPPLPRRIDPINVPAGFPNFLLALPAALPRSWPGSRLQMRNGALRRMVQVQNGFLAYNWWKERGDAYPRYCAIRPEFEELVKRFSRFLSNVPLPAAVFDQWEVTYVNRIPKGTVWRTPADWGNVLKLLSTPSGSPPDAVMRDFQGTWQLDLPNQQGRLYIEARGDHSVSVGQDSEDMLLSLTARGSIPEPHAAQHESLFSRIDGGHDAVVQGFTTYASQDAKSYWGLSV